MKPYKGYFISPSAMPVHPFSLDWYVGRSVLVTGHSSSIVEITRFQIERFTVSIKELAEWFGLEVARLVVDECLAPRESNPALLCEQTNQNRQSSLQPRPTLKHSPLVKGTIVCLKASDSGGALQNH
jgi:hypothetical protein